MNKVNFIRQTVVVAFLVTAVSFAGCKKDKDPDPVKVSGVSLNKSELTLIVGGSETLAATVAPADAANKAVTWKLSDAGIASVSDAGVVTAVKAGTATIIVSTADGGKMATCVVTVSATELVFGDDATYDIPAMTANVSIADIDLSAGASGGTASYAFAATGLPAGITISAAGVISGTPTAVAEAGAATVTVEDSSSPKQNKQITIAAGAVSVNPKYDEGVVINGITWATRNFDMPGTFADKPEDPGMFYQWNSTTALAVTGEVENWNRNWNGGYATLSGTDTWQAANNVCPAGWRLPTEDELISLIDADGNTWATTSANGRIFGSGDNSIFLPAAGSRYEIDGRLQGAGTIDFYWSGEVNSPQGAYDLFFYSDFPYTNAYPCAQAFSVRCVKE